MVQSVQLPKTSIFEKKIKVLTTIFHHNYYFVPSFTFQVPKM